MISRFRSGIYYDIINIYYLFFSVIGFISRVFIKEIGHSSLKLIKKKIYLHCYKFLTHNDEINLKWKEIQGFP